jgi:hypothetical protein
MDMYAMDLLTLIRKGPAKHVFEGMTFQGIDEPYIKNRVMMYEHGQNPIGILRVTEDGKTYRMTLEEQE